MVLMKEHDTKAPLAVTEPTTRFSDATAKQLCIEKQAGIIFGT